MKTYHENHVIGLISNHSGGPERFFLMQIKEEIGVSSGVETFYAYYPQLFDFANREMEFRNWEIVY